MRLALAVSLLVLVGGLSSAARAPQKRPTPAHQRAIDRIFSLQREIDRLLAELPTEAREDVRRRLAAGVRTSRTAPGEVSGVPSPGRPGAGATGAPASAPPESLSIFDDDGDGTIDGYDRVWGSLRVWVDANGDGRLTKTEVQQAGAMLHRLDAGLGTFGGLDGSAGAVRLDRYVSLDLARDGFGRRTAGALAVDADAARRAGFDFRSATGLQLTGVQPLASGWRVRTPGGRDLVLR